MTVHNTIWDILIYMMIYSFIGWAMEVCYHSIKNRHFENRGFINLPFNISYGIVAVILLLTLPTMGKQYIIQYLFIIIVLSVVRSITDYFIENIGKFEVYEYVEEDKITNSIQHISKLVLAAVCLLIYVVVHPIIFTFLLLIPKIVIKIVAIVFVVAVLLDLFGTIYAMRTGDTKLAENFSQPNKSRTQKLADKIIIYIWKRLEKSYPGINKASAESESKYVFAKGICVSKLIWVFLVSSFLGALIEMVYCFVLSGTWMNRSSVLYGPFSFVWGIGAVVLTVSLRRFSDRNRKNILKTFVAGFVIGGVYEYVCSVFTEIVFGTVFWDYSNMPLNIGGRTNVLYCIFWGLLGVVWTRVIYPPMSDRIEKLPALWGKIITWAIMIIMVCNGMITGAVMIRYTERQTNQPPNNIIEEIIDEQFDDAYMENRWPNMVVI